MTVRRTNRAAVLTALMGATVDKAMFLGSSPVWTPERIAEDMREVIASEPGLNEDEFTITVAPAGVQVIRRGKP